MIEWNPKEPPFSQHQTFLGKVAARIPVAHTHTKHLFLDSSVLLRGEASESELE